MNPELTVSEMINRADTVGELEALAHVLATLSGDPGVPLGEVLALQKYADLCEARAEELRQLHGPAHTKGEPND